MAGFLENISKLNQSLSTNPAWQSAQMSTMGFTPQQRYRTEQKIRQGNAAQDAALQRDQQFVEIVQAIGDRDPTRDELMVLYQLNPQATEFFAEFVMERRKAAAPMSSAGKIQADIDAGLIDPETGMAALRKATTSTPEYMMDQAGNIVAIDKTTGQIMPMGTSMGGAPVSLPKDTQEIAIPPEIAGNPNARQKYLETYAQNLADTPAGYRRTQDGGIEPIPGSKQAKEAELRAKGEERGKKLLGQGLRKVQESFDIINNDWFDSATGVGSQTWADWKSSSDASKLRSAVKTIQANLSIDSLIEAKKAGATFGALTDRELELLGAMVADLDPSLGEETLIENLNQVKQFLELSGAIPPETGNSTNSNEIKFLGFE